MPRKLNFLKPIKTALFNRFGLYFTWLISSPMTLDLRRCTRADVYNTVKTARANHPGASIYVLSDITLPAVADTFIINSVADLQKAITPCAVVLACNSDELALVAVRFIKSRKDMFYYGVERPIPAARYFHRDEAARMALKETWEAKLGKFDLVDFENIAQAIQATRRLEGAYVEIGVYRGDSAYFALKYMQRAGIRRHCYFFDTFSGFDYDGATSTADRTWLNTHTDASQEAVQTLLKPFNNSHEVIKANIITNALPAALQKIAVCNIDVDLYEAVVAALQKVAPLITQGGIIILEDQGHTPLLIGAFAAVRDFLASPEAKEFVPLEMLSGQLFLIKAL